MQFLLPATPSLKEYFLSLSRAKKFVFGLTLLFFITGGAFLAVGVYSAISPAVSPKASGSGLVSPTDFFGRASKSGGPASSDSNSTADKTAADPLNGVLYTPAEAAAFLARRPMAVMINNHPLARPQSNLSQADLVYEAVAEGGITRFLAVYLSNEPDKVGPVRSARKYFVDFAKENDAWYAHWGGASTANAANVYDYMRTIFVSSIDASWAGDKAFWRDFSRNVPIEHTGYTSIPKLYDVAYAQYPDQPRAWHNAVSSWFFKDDAEVALRPDSQVISFNFWDLPDFAVTWNYDKESNTYLRSQGGKAQADNETQKTLAAKDVVVLFMDEKPLNDEKAHLLYTTTGQGKGMAFLDGKALPITWSRLSVDERTRFIAENGEDLKLNRGQIWVEILPTGDIINYK
ncbi:MAG: DUF3048 domain-containing protein [Patescibacteria group bacterium]|nr:DUF3048 domain-containing protein [Patescibacteria group bacterium]